MKMKLGLVVMNIMAVMMAMMMSLMTLEGVWGHGMLLQPIQRSSMWRDRARFPDAPANYQDNELYCGGIHRQWEQNGGKCGPCGDPYDVARPRPNEAGGRYGRGVIVRNYTQGQLVDVTVRITADYYGFFVFKLCPNNDVTRPVDPACLDQHVLNSVGEDGSLGNEFHIYNFRGDKHMQVQLPSDVTCSQCVFQWTYYARNRWGCFQNSTCCKGCGQQETFVNCADITITPSSDIVG